MYKCIPYQESHSHIYATDWNSTGEQASKEWTHQLLSEPLLCLMQHVDDLTSLSLSLVQSSIVLGLWRQDDSVHHSDDTPQPEKNDQLSNHLKSLLISSETQPHEEDKSHVHGTMYVHALFSACNYSDMCEGLRSAFYCAIYHIKSLL